MTKETRELLRLSRSGDAAARAMLATRYREGDGGRRSLIRAFWWYGSAKQVDTESPDGSDYASANYASLCEMLVLDGLPPAERLLLRGVSGASGLLCRARRFFSSARVLRATLGFAGEFVIEMALVTGPVLLVLALATLIG